MLLKDVDPGPPATTTRALATVLVMMTSQKINAMNADQSQLLYERSEDDVRKGARDPPEAGSEVGAII
jgi:hypothetical protein